MNNTISSLLGCTAQLHTAVQKLHTLGLLVRSTIESDGLPAYTVAGAVKKQILNGMSSEAKLIWRLQALKLVTFIFPRPNISEG